MWNSVRLQNRCFFIPGVRRRFATLRPPSVLSIQSHVVYGAAGNSAAVFPMRRLGVNVWPLNTVQFSNHTQYGSWEGLPTANEQITALVEGISQLDNGTVLPRCNAVLSGYLGSPDQGGHVLDVVKKVKAANPDALYVCDPVMGHPAKGCVVPQGVQDHHAEASAGAADVLCPNVLELGVMTCSDPRSVTEVVQACHSLMTKGARMVLVKHLAHAGLSQEDRFEMLLVERSGEVWHVAVPLLHFDRPPVGVGDLTSAVFLASLLHGKSPKDALEHTAAAYFAVMQATSDLGEYELQLVAAQDGIANPAQRFAVTQL